MARRKDSTNIKYRIPLHWEKRLDTEVNRRSISKNMLLHKLIQRFIDFNIEHPNKQYEVFTFSRYDPNIYTVDPYQLEMIEKEAERLGVRYKSHIVALAIMTRLPALEKEPIETL